MVTDTQSNPGGRGKETAPPTREGTVTPSHVTTRERRPAQVNTADLLTKPLCDTWHGVGVVPATHLLDWYDAYGDHVVFRVCNQCRMMLTSRHAYRVANVREI